MEKGNQFGLGYAEDEMSARQVLRGVWLAVVYTDPRSLTGNPGVTCASEFRTLPTLGGSYRIACYTPTPAESQAAPRVKHQHFFAAKLLGHLTKPLDYK